MSTRPPSRLPLALVLLMALGCGACREQVIVGEEPKLNVPAASVRDAGPDARSPSPEQGDDPEDQMQGDQTESEQEDGENSSGDAEESNEDSEDTEDTETD